MSEQQNQPVRQKQEKQTLFVKTVRSKRMKKSSATEH